MQDRGVSHHDGSQLSRQFHQHETNIGNKASAEARAKRFRRSVGPMPMAFLAVGLVVVSALFGLPVFISPAAPRPTVAAKPQPHQAIGLTPVELVDTRSPSPQSESPQQTGSTIVRNGITVVSPTLLVARVDLPENSSTTEPGSSVAANGDSKTRSHATSHWRSASRHGNSSRVGSTSRRLAGLPAVKHCAYFSLPARF